MKNLQDILKYAMDMELRAKEFYSFYKDKVNNKSIKLMFESLVDMEDQHYNILKQQLDHLEKNSEIQKLDLTRSEGDNIINERAAELKDLDEDIGLATVYRVLTQFEAAGLVLVEAGVSVAAVGEVRALSGTEITRSLGWKNSQVSRFLQYG